MNSTARHVSLRQGPPHLADNRMLINAWDAGAKPCITRLTDGAGVMRSARFRYKMRALHLIEQPTKPAVNSSPHNHVWPGYLLLSDSILINVSRQSAEKLMIDECHGSAGANNRRCHEIDSAGQKAKAVRALSVIACWDVQVSERNVQMSM